MRIYEEKKKEMRSWLDDTCAGMYQAKGEKEVEEEEVRSLSASRKLNLAG